MSSRHPRILVVAPFTHQNGHFVTFPRDIACALAGLGYEVTLLHTRPFRTELDWLGASLRRICLRDGVDSSPWWWKEAWARLANRPSNQCLAWMIWKLRPGDYDLVLWTDFQAQGNLWPLTMARILRLYRFRTAFIEHHPPDECHKLAKLLPETLRPDRVRIFGLPMFVFSKNLHVLWEERLKSPGIVNYVPWGVWPNPLTERHRARARQVLGISEHARVLLVFGVQAVKRKHIDTLLQALAGFPPTKPLLLLFVGAILGREAHPFSGWQSPGAEARIEAGFISEERVELYFAATDAVWTNYRNFPGASGALLQAMGFGRLALSSNEGEIGALCREYNLGPLVASSSATHLRDALDQFVTLPKAHQLEWENQIASTAQRYAWPQTARQVMSHLGFLLPG